MQKGRNATRARSPKKDGPLQVTLKIPASDSELPSVQRDIRSARSLPSRASSVMSVAASTISSAASSRGGDSSPFVQLEWEGARHLQPTRLPSARHSERTVTMKLLEVTDETLEGLFEAGPELRRLDLSGTQLFAFPAELVPRLEQLERLVIDENRLASESFPRNFADLASLREISAVRNRLRHLPAVWLKLRHLSRLNVEANSIEQVRGVEKLRRLKSLVLDRNHISQLTREFYTLKRLELLFLANNAIAQLHLDVKNFTRLRELDLSGNRLQSLPPDVFALPRLEHLNASKNAINRIPPLSLKDVGTYDFEENKWKPKRRIQSVDLSNNALIRFPEHLMRIVETLDVSSNRIKVVPGALLKKIDWKTTQEVDVTFNPIIAPPREICDCGLRAMVQYYHESKIESKAYQGIKVLVLGSRGAGKTSLVQTLVDQQPRLVEEDERTLGLDVYEVAFETSPDLNDSKPLAITMWDFSGEPAYNVTNYFFLQLPSLTLLTFNLSTYKKENFHEVIGAWLDLLVTKNNRLILILVGTHADKVKKGRAKALLDQAKEDTENYMKAYIEEIESEIRKIESRPQISPALSEQFKLFLHLKTLRVLLHPESLAVSSSNHDGFDQLEKTIVDIACETKTFPSVMRVIPSLWIDIESYFEDRSNDEPLVTWEFFGELINRRFGLKHVAKNIGQYLHDTGKVLWADGDPNFTHKVVLRPPLLADLLRILFHHDLRGYMFDPLDRDEFIRRYLKAASSARLVRHRAQLLDEGILEPELARALLGGVSSSPQQLQSLLTYVCEDLELGYAVGKKLKDGIVLSPQASAKAAEPTSPGLAFREDAASPGANSAPDEMVRVLLPLNRRTEQPAAAAEEWARLDTERPSQLVAIFKFNRLLPPGLFERASVRLHRFEAFRLKYLAHWQNGVLMRHTEQPVLLQLLRTIHEDGQSIIQFEARFDRDLSEKSEYNEKEGGVKSTEAMWQAILPLIKDFEEVLQQYPGAWFRRQMACPFCGENTFLGEWLTPKELQCIPTKLCQLCRQDVPTIFLVQPREKRKVEEILRLKQQVRNRKRQEHVQKEEAVAAVSAEVKISGEGPSQSQSGTHHGSNNVPNDANNNQNNLAEDIPGSQGHTGTIPPPS